MAADTHASTKKLGVYSNKEANIYRFIDTSRNSKAAKAIYSSISAKPVLYGVVEYCFSGQRFKIRVDSENCSIAFGLIGVKIPQPDANSPTLTNISELAKNYAKNVLHQRDVALNIKYMDKRGSFLGNLWMLSGPKAKGDHFGKNILRKGYGNIQEDNVDKIDDYEDLEEAEKIAAGEQLGVWQPDVSARMTLATGDDYDAITDDIMSGTVVDMQDASNFYINLSKDQEKLEIISKKLSEYDDSSHEVLSHPIKNGTICAAKFKDDGNWYRGRVDSSIHSNDEHLYEIYFMDYGTKNDISIDNLKKIDDDLIQYPPLAHRCTLAYLSVPKGSQTFGNNASEMFKEHLWGKECSISFYDEDDYQYYVVINSGKEAKVNESINAYLLNEGFAKITNPESLPEELMEWKDYEQDAKDEQLNIWEIGGVDDQQD
ncbi:unnamed protein product [Moneuplotes crassus]|uniref:Tudor domain-containing protein n=1 Tax=Euplotes crassus TaxID=5936 RepID=A0AAD1XXY3_EUPCR|nr:unnamed protein product [Moneuplotes crassus]